MVEVTQADEQAAAEIAFAYGLTDAQAGVLANQLSLHRQAGIEEGLERAAGAAHPGNNENWDVATARSIQFAIRSLSHRREEKT